jgi:hypothetical protein
MELRLNTKGEAGIQPTDTLEEATEKYNQWQQSQPATADSEFRDFSSQEKRKLEQAGINWTTTEGYQEALDYLYEPKDAPTVRLTSTQLNQMAEKGLPADWANAIQEDLIGGWDESMEEIGSDIWEVIYKSMAGIVGPKKAQDYIQIYRDVLGRSGVLEIGTPDIRITQPLPFETWETETQPEPEIITPPEKTFKWWNPSTWTL